MHSSVSRLAAAAMAVLLLSACSSEDASEDTADKEGQQTDAQGLTWYKDVLPIVQTRCQGCHLEGGIAPFSLVEHQDAATRHQALASAVESGRMPPWMPSDDCQPLKHSRRLTPAEVEVFTKWSAAGAPAGNPDDAPKSSPGLPELARVDAHLKATDAYTPNSQLDDDYRCFILDPQLTADRFVTGMDIVPGVRSQVHHVLLYATEPGEAQAKEDAEAGLGWTCFGSPGTNPSKTSLVGGWVPGTGPTHYPADTGIRVSAGSVLVMQVHYNLAQGNQPDQTAVKLQYAESVNKEAIIFPLVENTFQIPPQAAGYSKESAFSSPLPFNLWGVIPHMHQKGKRLTVTQNDACLIDIPDWNFHWQQPYQFQTETGLPVEQGDVLKLRCEWDNPTDKTVTWGEGTEDEMCLNYLYLTR